MSAAVLLGPNQGPNLVNSSQQTSCIWFGTSGALLFSIVRGEDIPGSAMKSAASAVEEQRIEVEQLRREAAVSRIPVSEAVEDIKRFVDERQRDDHLVTNPGKRPHNLPSECGRKSSCPLQ